MGLDQRLGLSDHEDRALARESARLGYESVWTNAGPGRAALDRCLRWWRASAEVKAEGLAVGVSVVPVPPWSPSALAEAAAEVGAATGGRFILGIGSGDLRGDAVATMREWLATLRAELRGRVPVYLAALGPRMLRLAGELADGVALNWCTAEHVAWSRARVAEGAARAGRDPAAVRVIEYVRVGVDDDVDIARRALAGALLPYALGGDPRRGYRAHFARMGFDEALRELEARRDRGASPDELAEAFPPDLLGRVGTFRKPDDAADAFRRLAASLDLAIVRVVRTRPDTDAILRTLRACAPGSAQV